MLQSFVITLREGLEAFLIVAISLAYLRRTGRQHLVGAVQAGIGIAVAVSIAAGWLLGRARNQALWEALLAWAAAVLVGSLIVYMWRTGKRMRRAIETRLESSATRVGVAGFLSVLGFTVLMITREGMETALLMDTLLFQVQKGDVILGAIGGTVLAAVVAWLWSRYGSRVNLPRFFQVTAVFLFVFVIQLVVYGFHELMEANVGIPNSSFLHDLTEPYGPDGQYGQLLTYMLVLLPLGWLLLSNALSRHKQLRALEQ
jgi:high-affinity iron transporter